MKVLVAYMSQTGNTKKVAEAIYGAIEGDKEIMPAGKVASLAGYDLAFLGFPVLAGGPGKSAKVFLEGRAAGCKVALFITHGSAEGASELEPELEAFRQAASKAQLVGMFNCRGQMAGWLRFMMRLNPDPEWKRRGRDTSGQGQPDAARLERARAFAREIMQQGG